MHPAWKTSSPMLCPGQEGQHGLRSALTSDKWDKTTDDRPARKKHMPCRSLQLPCLWLRWAMLQKDLKRSKVSKVSQGFLQQYYWDHLILKQIHDFFLNMSPWSNPMGRPCTHWADFAVRAKKNRCHHAWAWTEIWTQSGLIEQNYLGTVTIPSFYIYSLSGFSVGS